jgi:hypothetical protein
MRSVAVLLTAGIAEADKSINPGRADALAAIVVSVIILGSLVRLLQGLALTAAETVRMLRNPPRRR